MQHKQRSAGAMRDALTARGGNGSNWLLLVLIWIIAVALLLLSPRTANATPAPPSGSENPFGLPFTAGEELVYQLNVRGLGRVGSGAMRVQSGHRVRGQETYLLSFDLRGRVVALAVEDNTRSWLNPRTMATLRYEKHERHPLSSRSEEVDVFPSERRWVAASGESGRSATDTPLDELSFIYHVRTLPLRTGDTYTCNMHFDADRNPVRIRVMERTRTRVPAGEFATVLIEMRVRDPHRYGGEGVIRMYLTDDERRIPVRIESPMPTVGTTVLMLQSATPGGR